MLDGHALHRLLAPLFVSFALLAGNVTKLYAEPGGPDPGFSDDGWLGINFGSDSALQAVTELADGSLLVAGNAGGARVELRRVLLDGSIDISFGFLGQVFVDIPDASGARVVKLLEAPDGPGYLVLIQATRAGGPEGVLTRLGSDGSLCCFPGDGFADLDLSGSRAVSDLFAGFFDQPVVVSGQVADGVNTQAAVRFVDPSTGVVQLASDFGPASTDDWSGGASFGGSADAAILWRNDFTADTLRLRQDDGVNGTVELTPFTLASSEIEPAALTYSNSSGIISASWVPSGQLGQPLLLKRWGVSLRGSSTGFGSDDAVLYTPPLAFGGFEGFRPAEIEARNAGDGRLIVAGTLLGSPTGPLRRGQVLAFDSLGDLLLEGPELVSPDVGRDHEVTDMVLLRDGRIALTVVTIDRSNLFSTNGWLVVLESTGLFADGFEGGSTGAWSSTTP